MTFGRTRNALVFTFVAGLVLAAAITCTAFAKETIASSDLASLLGTLLAIYAVHLGVILGAIFGNPKTRATRTAGMAGPLAIVLAVLWNLLLLFRLALFAAAVFNPERNDNVEDVISYIQTVGTASSFLIAGTLSFFFARSTTEP